MRQLINELFAILFLAILACSALAAYVLTHQFWWLAENYLLGFWPWTLSVQLKDIWLMMGFFGYWVAGTVLLYLPFACIQLWHKRSISKWEKRNEPRYPSQGAAYAMLAKLSRIGGR